MAKYVITGGPCVGKTTTLNELARRGYKTAPEAARMIIQEEQAKPNGILPWTDLLGFQHLVLQRQINLEQRLWDGFLDRAIDGIAYCRLGKIEVPKELIYFAKTNRYDCIIFPDALPYKLDSERKEDEATAKKIHDEIFKVYVEFGYNPIRVPVLPVDKRADFILEKIKK